MAERREQRTHRGGMGGRSTDRGRMDRRPGYESETGPADEGYSPYEPGRYRTVDDESYDIDREYVETRWGERELAPGWGWGPSRESVRGHPRAASVYDDDDEPIRWHRGTMGRGALYGYDGNAVVMRPSEDEDEGEIPLVGEYRGVGPKSYRRSDERIREDVCREMTEHPLLDCSEVEVAVEDGQVILTGTMSEWRFKRLAEDIALEVPGVVDVLNQIRVHRATSPALSEERR